MAAESQMKTERMSLAGHLWFNMSTAAKTACYSFSGSSRYTITQTGKWYSFFEKLILVNQVKHSKQCWKAQKLRYPIDLDMRISLQTPKQSKPYLYLARRNSRLQFCEMHCLHTFTRCFWNGSWICGSTNQNWRELENAPTKHVLNSSSYDWNDQEFVESRLDLSSGLSTKYAWHDWNTCVNLPIITRTV